MEVDRVVGERKPKVHSEEPAVTGRMAVPLAVDAQDDVAPVPEGGAEVYFLIAMKVGRRGRSDYIR